jgi:hypothetical protein
MSLNVADKPVETTDNRTEVVPQVVREERKRTGRTERRPYSRTGKTALKAKVKIRGLQAIDKRTLAGAALCRWRKELAEDLGGEDQLSAAQKTLIDHASRTILFVDTLDLWIMENGTLVNRKRRCVLPVVRERQQLADSLARTLQLLGLKRRAREIPTLAEYLERRAASTPPCAAAGPDQARPQTEAPIATAGQGEAFPEVRRSEFSEVTGVSDQADVEEPSE